VSPFNHRSVAGHYRNCLWCQRNFLATKCEVGYNFCSPRCHGHYQFWAVNTRRRYRADQAGRLSGTTHKYRYAMGKDFWP
jgi:hypothetical protein